MRIPVYELHIKPLFRLIDREGMLWSFDLFDYAQVVQHAEQIADRAAVDMPPVAKGGPWPKEFVDLFRRWMATGFKRLELGTAEYTWAGSPTSGTITAKGTYPKEGYKGWLQLEELTASSRTYCLYLEAPYTVLTGSPGNFLLKDKFKSLKEMDLFVKDLTGIHKVH